MGLLRAPSASHATGHAQEFFHLTVSVHTPVSGTSSPVSCPRPLAEESGLEPHGFRRHPISSRGPHLVGFSSICGYRQGVPIQIQEAVV